MWEGPLRGLGLSINMLPADISREGYDSWLLDEISAAGMDPSRVTAEITESALLVDQEAVAERLNRLREAGLRIAVDDFGTGYASLAQVNRLPLDRIKIDKSFITTIVKSEQTAAIVNTIAGLGHNLSVPITAEGVESEQIRSALADFGCSEAQGWLFGRAISAEAVRNFLAMNNGTATLPSDADQPSTDEQPKRKSQRW